MMNSRVSLICTLIFAMLFTLVTPNQAHADEEAALSVRSVGVFDTDGTVLYSVLIASKADPINKVTITSEVPENTTFVEVIAAPPDVVVKQDANSVSWQVTSIDKDSILGPFTFRVKLADNANQAPATVKTHVTWEQPSIGSADAEVTDTTVTALAEYGKLELDDKGTVNDKGENTAVAVGDTGIMIYVPKGAVSQKTTLTFTRVPVDAKSTPAGVVDYWWCASVKITADPVVAFTKPFSISLPTRRTLTPGLPSKFFMLGADGQWQLLGDDVVASISPDGNGIMAITVSPESVKLGNGVSLTGGVTTSNRASSAVSGTTLTTTKIVDGTSNTIASKYVEQDNIIAILIGAK